MKTIWQHFKTIKLISCIFAANFLFSKLGQSDSACYIFKLTHYNAYLAHTTVDSSKLLEEKLTWKITAGLKKVLALTCVYSIRLIMLLSLYLYIYICLV